MYFHQPALYRAMNHPNRMPQVHQWVSAMLACLMLLIAPGVCIFAQDVPVNDAAAPQAAPGPTTTFNWHDLPVNENIPIQHASFDAGGYQLVDSQGQTIVVPFENNSLYVMKFGQSTTGTMYFVNAGTAPILYVPQGTGINNLTVSGAVWYPPTPVYPVYYGIAPSWDNYVAMGWYPDMHYSGGYYYSRGVYVATPGLYVEIGGTRSVGWPQYVNYYHLHSGWRHVTTLNRSVYSRDPSRRSEYNSSRGVSPGNRYGGYHPEAAPSAGNKWGQRPPGTPLRPGPGGALQQRSTTGDGRKTDLSSSNQKQTTTTGGGPTAPGNFQKPNFTPKYPTGVPGSNPKQTSKPGSGTPAHPVKTTNDSKGSGASSGTKKQ